MADLSTRSYGNRPTCRSTAPTDYCNTVSDDLTRYVRVGNREEIIYGYGFTNNTRLNALRYVARDFVSRVLDEGDATSRMGVVRWADTVVNSRPLTSDAAQIRTEITNMAAHSGTNPYLAMLQASVLARDFAPSHIKAVVLLTDGKPTQLDEVFYYPPDGRQSDRHGCTGGTFCAPAVNQTLPICTQLKNDGVQVYTVGFLNPTDREFVNDPGSYNRAVAFLRDCASVDGEGNPRYYTAENGAQLNEAFTQILTSLGRIRISQ